METILHISTVGPFLVAFAFGSWRGPPRWCQGRLKLESKWDGSPPSFHCWTRIARGWVCSIRGYDSELVLVKALQSVSRPRQAKVLDLVMRTRHHPGLVGKYFFFNHSNNRMSYSLASRKCFSAERGRRQAFVLTPTFNCPLSN